MPPARRLVRRQPLWERIMGYLEPGDVWLWVSEELNSNDWEDFEKAWSLPFGLGCNLIFLLARANSGGQEDSGDVFGDYEGKRGSGWLKWLCRLFVLMLASFSFANAFYTLTRKRHYRLFEQEIENIPSTPSARRVRVDSSPASSSPLGILQSILTSNSAQTRAHPDQARDVWEVSVWDPTPLCLRLFCYFSPGHVLAYWSFFPLAPLDPRPSVTVFLATFFALILSVQLSFLRSHFIQQATDNTLIKSEVLHEYDRKYVHATLNRPVRDVGIQTPPRQTTDAGHGGIFKSKPTTRDQASEVDLYTPTTIINRGFHTNPNPAYASSYDPDNQQASSTSASIPRPNFTSTLQPRSSTPSLRTTPHMANTKPNPNYSSTSTSTSTTKGTSYPDPYSAATLNADYSSPLRPPPNSISRSRTHRQSSPQKLGDGGSLGVYSHTASPLRKAASANYLRDGEAAGSGYSARREREGSPLKRVIGAPEEGGRSGAGSSGGFGQRLRGERDRKSGFF
ncbi:hypothetical protein K402DRAFT_462789 [Aulographum hederae CBS 113979]|uniref:DUF2418 domain-containing protein n=1 Tax=Aulographum hederae CBS 113979 TaxID=1176131 RepID=A0A6G1H3E8_9PEZI|nr:hypothetical protein K402DRAFT_462789 [Aulographum hederae CBS 113979]